MKKLLVILICLLCVFGCEEKKEYASITGEEVVELINEENVFVIDVRTVEEYKSGHIDGAINLPFDLIQSEISSIVKDKESKIIVYCTSGNRSKKATNILLDKGYKNVYDLGSISNYTGKIVN